MLLGLFPWKPVTEYGTCYALTGGFWLPAGPVRAGNSCHHACLTGWFTIPGQHSCPHWKGKGGMLFPPCGNGAMKVDCKQTCDSGCWNGAHVSWAFTEWQASGCEQFAPFTCSPWGLGPASRCPVRCTSVCLLPGGPCVGNAWGNDVYLIVFPWHKLPADFLLYFNYWKRQNKNKQTKTTLCLGHVHILDGISYVWKSFFTFKFFKEKKKNTFWGIA